MSVISHAFPVTVAKSVGVESAVMLSNMFFWIEKNRANDKNFYDGAYWTYNSMKAFEEIFPYWTFNQIRRILTNLEKDGYIISGNYNKVAYDRTKWYTLSDKGLALFNITTCDNPQHHLRICTNGDVNNNKPIPDINTDNKTDNTLIASKDAQREQIDKIVEIWNQIEGLPQVRRITETSKRYKYASARLKEEGFDTVVEVIQKVASSDFLRGKNRNNWTANFEWAMTVSNFIKILEDTYINKESNHEAGRTNNSADKLERIYEEGRRAIEEFDFENFDGTF